MTKSPIEQAIEAIERGKEMVSQFAEPEAILDDPEEYCGTDDGPETLCMVFDNMRHQALTGYENALTALRQHQQDGGWLPIESAPRDGTRVLCWSDELYQKPYIAWYGEDDGFHEVSPGKEWLTGDGDSWSTGYNYTPCRPTLFQPLPPAPKKENDDA